MSQEYYRIRYDGIDYEGNPRVEYISGYNHSNDLYQSEGPAKAYITRRIRQAVSTLNYTKPDNPHRDVWKNAANPDNYIIEKWILTKVEDE